MPNPRKIAKAYKKWAGKVGDAHNESAKEDRARQVKRAKKIGKALRGKRKANRRTIKQGKKK